MLRSVRDLASALVLVMKRVASFVIDFTLVAGAAWFVATLIRSCLG